MSSELTYSQRLKPDQVQKIYDTLNIPWREYEPNPDGWVQIDAIHFHNSVSAAGFDHVTFDKPALNIIHGGYIDHFYNGMLKGKDYDFDTDVIEVKKAVKGDVVDLVRRFLYGISQTDEATTKTINWINKLLGKREINPSQFIGKTRAKDFISNKEDIFVIVPKPLLSASISAGSKLVWCEIHDQCRKGKYCSWPSINTIAERTSLSRSTVIRSLQELEESGFLITQKKEGANNLYYPVLPEQKIIPVSK